MANGIGRVGWRNFAPTIPSISTNGLIVNLDASNPLSYSGTGTTWTDLSGNGNNGTLYNGTSYSSANGGTMVFDGVNDYIRILTGLPISNTLSVWFKQPAPTGGGLLETNTLTGIGGGSPYLFVGLGTNYIRTYNEPYGYSTNSEYTPTNWYNVTITGSGGTRNIYINGVFTATKVISFSVLNQNSSINIGAGYPGYFNGNVPVVHAYNRVLTQAEITNNFDALKGRFATPTYTTRTTAFAAATGITDTTILNALNTFDTGLISNGLDTKMKALYPFVGGTSTAHKFNFMDARDSDAAFRLQFFGGGTHGSNGYKPNATNAYADTKINDKYILTLNDEHISYYSRTNSVGSYADMGNIAPHIVGNPGLHLHLKWLDGNFYPRVADNNSGVANSGTSQGLFIANRTNSTQVRAFQNGTLKLITSNSISKSDLNIYIGALNNSFTGASLFTNRECAFSSIGSGLSDSEATTFYNLVQALQTSLSRQV
jgi:hypothetical protein